MKNSTLIMSAALATLLAGAATAQTSTFNLDGASDTAVDDLEERIANERERDVTFGNDGRTPGTYGSIAMRASSTSEDGAVNSDVSLGLRYGSFDGVNGFDVTASYTYTKADGADAASSLLTGLDYRRDFTPSIFGYGKLEASFNKEATDVGAITQEVFVGAGVGYRIFNTSDLQWSVQAGPGYRVVDAVANAQVSEAAASISNNVFYSLSDTAYITNDTDVIYSEFATTVNNDLAINVALTDTLSLRTSYATSYNDQTDSTFSDAKNIFGASVVYNF